MQSIAGIELKEGSLEERLPGFAADFPYIASCVEFEKLRESGAPWHWHRAVEVFYMESGSLEYTTPNGKWIFPAGSGGFTNSNVLHTSRVLSSGERNVSLIHLFDPSLIAGEHGSRMERKYVMPLISAPGIELIALYPEDPEQARILEWIRHAFELSEEEWGYEFRLREELTQIWMAVASLSRNAERTGKGGHSNDSVKQMMRYIQEHYSQSISIGELAEQAYISRRSCFRLFQENLHMTPVEYIRAFRLQMACRMLANGKEPVTEIAGRCGLGSSSYFGKIFREEFGCTPLEYRRRWHDRESFGHQTDIE